MATLLVGVTAALARVENWRSYAPTVGGGGVTEERTHAEKPGGVVRWLTTVDHKDIGILYGTFAVLSFAWGGVAVVLMRFELLFPRRTSSGRTCTTACSLPTASRCCSCSGRRCSPRSRTTSSRF